MMRTLALTAAMLMVPLAACTSPQQARVERQARTATAFLERQGSIGDPGRVAAADLAFARMARDEGTWTAFRAYAAPGAVMDDDTAAEGVSPVLAQLEGLADPAQPIEWSPTTVWSSCDGRLAFSIGRSRRPSGIVGSYVTVWELQDDNQYRYIYDTGTPDDPQPAPRPAQPIPDDAIVVPGETLLEGFVADCPRRGETLPEIPMALEAGVQSDWGDSPDKTLSWTRVYRPDGSRAVRVYWVREGRVQQALDYRIPASD